MREQLLYTLWSIAELIVRLVFHHPNKNEMSSNRRRGNYSSYFHRLTHFKCKDFPYKDLVCGTLTTNLGTENKQS